MVVAASSGGLRATSDLRAALPADVPVPIILVQHRMPRHEHLLAEILRQRIALRVVMARSGIRLRGGTVYVAPSVRQALVRPSRTRQVEAPRDGQ